MHQIQKIFGRNRRKLLELPNVTGVGIGHKIIGGQPTNQPAIIVMVKKKLQPQNLSRTDHVPSQLDGAATDVIEVGELRLLNRTQYLRPAPPGCSLGHYKITAGTFGAVVRDNRTGAAMILSNNHVLANMTRGTDGLARVGDPILQPGAYDGGTKEQTIATLERFVPLNRDLHPADCPRAAAVERIGNHLIQSMRPHYQMRLFKTTGNYNLVDAAIARPLTPASITPSVMEIGQIAGSHEATVKMLVKKSGRTSGTTQGRVLSIQATLQIMLAPDETATFEDQIVMDPISQPGDSGSLIVDEHNFAVGLLFAGSDQATIANRIQNVLSLLDISI